MTIMIEFAKKDKLSLKSCLGIVAVLSGSIGFSLPAAALQAGNGKPAGKAWDLPALILNDLVRAVPDEIPYFMKYQQNYAGQWLRIVGVGLDDARKLRNYARTLGINYPILRADPGRQYALLNPWGDPAGVLPFTVIIDQHGRIIRGGGQ